MAKISRQIVSDQKNEVLNSIDAIEGNSGESVATRLIALEEIQNYLRDKIEELEDQE